MEVRPEISELKALAQHLWGLRFNRDLASFEAGFLEFQKRASTHSEMAGEIQLLEAARLRGQGRMQESDDVLRALASSNHGLEKARITFQVAVNLFHCGDETKAWPLFAEVADQTKDPLTRLASLDNLAICLQHLGIDHGARLDQAEAAAREARALGVSGVEWCESQHLVIRMRDRFKAGRIDEAIALFDAAASRKGQPNFLVAWLSRLPFARGAKKDLGWVQEVMLSDRSVYLQNARLQTVLGIYDPSEKISHHDRVDRIYLWMWWYLTGEQAISFSWIAEEIAAVLNRSSQVYSAEDTVMMRNVLGWCQLIEGREPIDVIAAVNSQFRKGILEYPIFEEEWRFIQELYQTLSNRKAAPTSKIFGSIEDTVLAKWIEYHRHRSGSSTSEVRVFLDEGLIISGSESMYDPNLSRLLSLIDQCGTVSFENVATDAIGAPNYSSDLHDPMIQRLVVKARSLLSDSTAIRIRGPSLVSSGPSGVVFVRQPTIERPSRFAFWRSVTQTSAVKTAVAGESKRQIPSWITTFSGKKTVLRSEIQEVTGWSKSTTTRMIAESLEKGWLVKTGGGASVAYEIRVEL